VARSFDTGLSIPKRTLVRNKVIELLQPLLKGGSYMRGDEPMAGFLRAIVKVPGTLQSFNYEDNDSGIKLLYALLLGRTPSIGVALGDRVMKPAGVGGARGFAALDVHLYFVNNHQRSMMARLESDVVSVGDEDEEIEADDEADPGIDVMLECAEELLTAERLDTTQPGAVVKHLELKREEDVYTGRQHCIWMQVWEVGVTSTINKKRAITQRIEGFNTTLPTPGETDPQAEVDFVTEVSET